MKLLWQYLCLAVMAVPDKTHRCLWTGGPWYRTATALKLAQLRLQVSPLLALLCSSFLCCLDGFLCPLTCLLHHTAWDVKPWPTHVCYVIPAFTDYHLPGDIQRG